MTNEIEYYVDGSAINNENPNVRTLGGIGVYRRHNTENGINIITAKPDHNTITMENGINIITAKPDHGYAINVDADGIALRNNTTPLDLGKVTNNTTELAAIYYALQIITRGDEYDNCIIYGDSQYAGNLVFGNWKAKQNKELVARVKALAKTLPDVTWEYVKAHDGNVYNEYADYLAKSGAYNRTPLPFDEWKTTEF